MLIEQKCPQDRVTSDVMTLALFGWNSKKLVREANCSSVMGILKILERVDDAYA